MRLMNNRKSANEYFMLWLLFLSGEAIRHRSPVSYVCAEVNPSFPASVGERGAHQAGAEEPTITDERSAPLRQNPTVLP